MKDMFLKFQKKPNAVLRCAAALCEHRRGMAGRDQKAMAQQLCLYLLSVFTLFFSGTFLLNSVLLLLQLGIVLCVDCIHCCRDLQISS